jgi:hypothetical protein
LQEYWVALGALRPVDIGPQHSPIAHFYGNVAVNDQAHEVSPLKLFVPESCLVIDNRLMVGRLRQISLSVNS